MHWLLTILIEPLLWLTTKWDRLMRLSFEHWHIQATNTHKQILPSKNQKITKAQVNHRSNSSRQWREFHDHLLCDLAHDPGRDTFRRHGRSTWSRALWVALRSATAHRSRWLLSWPRSPPALVYLRANCCYLILWKRVRSSRSVRRAWVGTRPHLLLMIIGFTSADENTSYGVRWSELCLWSTPVCAATNRHGARSLVECWSALQWFAKNSLFSLVILK